ncbi:MAG: hypothetical protein DMG38_28195 [Acidobacteria bacterium]|nr:MAG: hypothetical protein DMG38_28195 [Acidobacteriota bacterium]
MIDNKRVIPFEWLENAIAGDLRCLTERDEGNIHGERERRRIASKRAASNAATPVRSTPIKPE